MSLFTDLLRNSASQRNYAAEITGYDLKTNTLRTLYLSTNGFTSHPTDTPSNFHFDGRLEGGFIFQRQLFTGANIGGRSIPSFGQLNINNADGLFDDLADWSLDGRRCVIRMGGRNFRYADFGIVFDGIMDGIDFNDQTLTIRLRGPEWLLDRPVLTTSYLGTGGLEGPANLKGQKKPGCFGNCRNITPYYLGVIGGFPTYQVHDGPIQNIYEVRDNGIILTKSVGSPSPSQYQEDLTNGTFRLGSVPAGVVTADVLGDKTGNIFRGFPGALVQLLAQIRGPISSIESASLLAMNSTTSGDLGLYLVDETPISAAIDAIVNSVGGYWGFNRYGTLVMSRLEVPSATPVMWFDDFFSLQRQQPPPPTWRITIGYRQNWTMQDGSALAGAATDGIKAYVSTRFRAVSSEDATLQGKFLGATDERFDTLIDLESDATNEAVRRRGLYSVPRAVYRVDVDTQPFILDLGQTIGLRYPRYDLQNGKAFRIIGMTEDALSNRVQLTLWG